jgi:hypothetical protein
MKKIMFLLLSSSLIAPMAFANCDGPTTPNEAIQCLVNAFNQRNVATISSASEIYQYNYNLGHNALINHVDSWDRFKSLPYYAYDYSHSVAKDSAKLSADIKSKQFESLPEDFSRYKTDRRALFTDAQAKDFANYLVKEEEQLLGKIQGVSGNEAKASEYAQLNLIGYIVPATSYELYAFLSQDADKYLNSAVLTYKQSDCENNVASFQANFADQVAKNGTLKVIMDATHPDSLLRDIAPVLSKSYAPYVIGSLDTMYAFGEGKAVSGSSSIAYNICSYDAFQNVVASGKNPEVLMLNDIVNKLSTKSKYAPQNVYWLLTAMSSKALTMDMSNVTLSTASGVMPY